MEVSDLTTGPPLVKALFITACVSMTPQEPHSRPVKSRTLQPTQNVKMTSAQAKTTLILSTRKKWIWCTTISTWWTNVWASLKSSARSRNPTALHRPVCAFSKTLHQQNNLPTKKTPTERLCRPVPRNKCSTQSTVLTVWMAVVLLARTMLTTPRPFRSTTKRSDFLTDMWHSTC